MRTQGHNLCLLGRRWRGRREPWKEAGAPESRAQAHGASTGGGWGAAGHTAGPLPSRAPVGQNDSCPGDEREERPVLAPLVRAGAELSGPQRTAGGPLPAPGGTRPSPGRPAAHLFHLLTSPFAPPQAGTKRPVRSEGGKLCLKMFRLLKLCFLPEMST